MIVIFEGREKFFRAEKKNSRTLVWTVYRCKTKIYTHVLSVERKRRGRVKTKVGWGEVLLIKSWGRILGLAVAATYKFTPLSINAIEVLSFCGRRARGQRGNIVYIYIYIYSPSFPTSWATMLSPATAHRTSKASPSSRTSQFSFDWNQTTNRLRSFVTETVRFLRINVTIDPSLFSRLA